LLGRRLRKASRARPRPQASYNANRSRLLGAPLVVRRRRGQCFHTAPESGVQPAVPGGLRKASRAWPHGARRPSKREG